LHQLITFNDEIKKQELQLLEHKHANHEKKNDDKDNQNKLLVNNRLKTLENAAAQLSTYLSSISLVKPKNNNNHNIEEISEVQEEILPKVESLNTALVKKIKIKNKKKKISTSGIHPINILPGHRRLAKSQEGQGLNDSKPGLFNTDITKLLGKFKTKGYVGTFAIDELNKLPVTNKNYIICSQYSAT